MARVNHKKVKQMLEETRKKITDRQFFTSRILAGHYEDMAAAQTRRYKYNRRIKMKIIWKPREQSIAVTNNLNILINAGHPIVTKRNRLRQDRYMIVTGLFTHELGHALFTDFLASQTYTNFLAAYKWYPCLLYTSFPLRRICCTHIIGRHLRRQSIWITAFRIMSWKHRWSIPLPGM